MISVRSLHVHDQTKIVLYIIRTCDSFIIETNCVLTARAVCIQLNVVVEFVHGTRVKCIRAFLLKLVKCHQWNSPCSLAHYVK